MLPPTKILFPVDFSPRCEEVAPYVRDMTSRFSAGLTLVHSYGPEAVGLSGITLTDPALPERIQQIEDKRLRSFAAKTFPDITVETVVENGEPGSVIYGLARAGGTDLIMLGTHGHGPVRRLLLGSVATKVLHDVDCAVWTVNAGIAGQQPHRACTSILCAVDESEEAEAIVLAGALMAKTYGARLSIAHVVETPVAAVEIDYAPLRNDLVDAADRRLREIKEKTGTTAPHRVLDGAVADCIREEAARRHADLIVTGRGRIRGTLSRFWAHLYAIVRDAPCPVLSI
jgi:nucleotide-binding universal stress UspA family protein